MCWQDVLIGRATHTTFAPRSVGVTAGEFVGPSPRRRVLIFTPATGTGYWVSTEPDVAVGRGLFVGAADRPIVLTLASIGDGVTKPWYAVADTAAANPAVGEGLLAVDTERGLSHV